MKITFIISLFFFIIPATLKGIIHVVLDVKNGHRVDFARSKGYVYLLPYDKDVSVGDEKLKRACNCLQSLSAFSLVAFIIIFVARFIISK